MAVSVEVIAIVMPDITHISSSLIKDSLGLDYSITSSSTLRFTSLKLLGSHELSPALD